MSGFSCEHALGSLVIFVPSSLSKCFLLRGHHFCRVETVHSAKVKFAIVKFAYSVDVPSSEGQLKVGRFYIYTLLKANNY